MLTLTAALMSTLVAAEPAWPDRYSFGQPERSGDVAAWWMALEDPVLDDLIQKALDHNGDLRAGWARVDASEIQAQNAIAPLLPAVRFEAAGNVAPYNSLGFQFGGFPSGGFTPQVPGAPLETQFAGVTKDRPPLVFFSGSALFKGQWQLDLGRTVMNQRAASHDASAAENDVQQNQMVTARELTRAYFDLAAAKEQLTIIDQQIANQRTVLELTELRFDAGQSTAVDVLQQKQQLASTEALRPQAMTQVRILERQIGILIGTYESINVRTPERVPDLAPLSAVGQPEDLAEGRADVRAAKQRIDAAEARSWAAMLNFLPTLAFTGQAGAQAFMVEDPKSQWVWGAGAVFTLPIFQSGQNIQGFRAAKANEAVSKEQYFQLRRRVVQAVEMARVREDEISKQLAATRTQRDAADKARQESLARFEAGLVTYPQVLIAEGQAFQAELTLLTQRRQLLAARIDLLDALGGAFTQGVRP